MARYPGAEKFLHGSEFIEKLHWNRFVLLWRLSVAVERVADYDEMWSYQCVSDRKLRPWERLRSLVPNSAVNFFCRNLW
jgi:hypothetical protein